MCTHYFIFPEPDGEFCTGICQKCGKTIKCRNSLSDKDFTSVFTYDRAPAHTGENMVELILQKKAKGTYVY